VRFPDCASDKPLGIYPVVDRADKLEPLYECGISTAQLRVKDLKDKALENEIIQAIEISQKYNVRLFINDYWQLAIKYGAYGIHLGQEDILEADIEQIYNANIRLGISTHTPKEIKIALDIKPSYVAIGQIYETTSKKMVYNPVGIEDLKNWAKVVDYPIVAIGGINIDNIRDVLATKTASGIAMISGVLENGKVSKAKTKKLIEIFENEYQ
jgi:thiamine-phosphate diphosphorylase